MEQFPVYKLPPIPKPELFVPPPYCRRAERTRNETEEELVLPSLKLTVSNPSRILLLFQTLTDNTSKPLEVKLNTYLTKHSESKMVFLLHLFPVTEEAVVQTLGSQELEQSLRFPLSEKFLSELIKYECKSVTCDENSTFLLAPIFKEILGTLDHITVIGVPILRRQNIFPCHTKSLKPVLLTCFVNSKKNEDILINLASELFKFCLPLLLNTMEAEEEARQKRQYQFLLSALYRLALSIEDTNLLTNYMATETRKLMRAQHATVFLKDPNHVDLMTKILGSFTQNEIDPKVKKALDYQITKTVIDTGKIVKAVSPIDDEKLTEDTDYEIKNLLCFPLRTEDGIIGAMQVYNKRRGIFDRFDEEIAKIFDIFGGMLINQSVEYARNANANIRSNLADDLMLSWLQVDKQEVQRILSCSFMHYYKEFDEFSFCPRHIVPKESICFVLQMVEKLNFFSRFSIDKKTFTNFLVHIRDGCRDVPYHNWMHLFSTAHFAYLCLKNLELMEGYFSHLEGLAFFISCLCHDVDYKGCKNPFQEHNDTLFESLYSSPGSAVERHRLSQILRILNMNGCNFLNFLTFMDYSLFVELLKDFCLGTDLATHFKLYKRQYKMVSHGYNKGDVEHRFAFVNLLMTCADLSDHTRDWSVVKEVVGLVYEELVDTQPKKEETKAKKEETEAKEEETEPKKEETEAKKKETRLLSDLEAELLKEVCLPAYKLLRGMFPEFKETVARIKKHILYWECSRHVFQKGIDDGLSCLDVLKHEDFDKKVEAAVYVVETTKPVL